VLTCVAHLKAGRVSERCIRDVLKYNGVDVSPVASFLSSLDPAIRLAAVRIVGEKGDPNLLINIVKNESEKPILLEAMKALGKRGKNLNELVSILETSDSLVKQEAIAMFRKSGEVDCLFSLLFDKDQHIVEQVKGYFNGRQ
jgi:hypothetical protein